MRFVRTDWQLFAALLRAHYHNVRCLVAFIVNSQYPRAVALAFALPIVTNGQNQPTENS